MKTIFYPASNIIASLGPPIYLKLERRASSARGHGAVISLTFDKSRPKTPRLIQSSINSILVRIDVCSDQYILCHPLSAQGTSHTRLNRHARSPRIHRQQPAHKRVTIIVEHRSTSYQTQHNTCSENDLRVADVCQTAQVRIREWIVVPLIIQIRHIVVAKNPGLLGELGEHST